MGLHGERLTRIGNVRLTSLRVARLTTGPLCSVAESSRKVNFATASSGKPVFQPKLTSSHQWRLHATVGWFPLLAISCKSVQIRALTIGATFVVNECESGD